MPDIREKTVRPEPALLAITPDMDCQALIAWLKAIRQKNAVANMAFYAYRNLARTEPKPFLLAALKRNPVLIAGTAVLTEEQVLKRVADMPNESIYDGPGGLRPTVYSLFI